MKFSKIIYIFPLIIFFLCLLIIGAESSLLETNFSSLEFQEDSMPVLDGFSYPNIPLTACSDSEDSMPILDEFSYPNVPLTVCSDSDVLSSVEQTDLFDINQELQDLGKGFESNILDILTSPVSSEIEYSDSWQSYGLLGFGKKWHQVSYRGINTDSIFSQQKILESLLNLNKGILSTDSESLDIDGIKEITLYEEVEGVLLNVSNDNDLKEWIMIFPHITNTGSQLVIISLGTDKGESEVESRTEELNNIFKEVVESKLDEINEYINKPDIEDEGQKTNWSEEAKIIISELGEEINIDEMLEGKELSFKDIVNIDEEGSVSYYDFMNLTVEGDYNEKGIYLDIGEEVNLVSKVNSGEIALGDNIDYMLEVVVKPVARNFNSAESISFDFSLEGFHKGWTPDLVVKLISGEGEGKKVAEVVLDDVKQGKNSISIDMDEIRKNLPEGFELSSVSKIELGIRIVAITDNMPLSIPEGTSIAFENINLKHLSYDKVEVLNYLYSKLKVKSLVAGLFGKNIEDFNNIINNSKNALYNETYGKYVNDIFRGTKSLQEAVLDILWTKKNIEFLVGQKNENIGKMRGFTFENDVEMLNSFEEILEENQDSVINSLLFSSDREFRSLQNQAWDGYVSFKEEQPESSNLADYLKDDLKNRIFTYLDFEGAESFGSVYHNTMYWLGSKLGEKYRFSFDERKMVDKKIDEYISQKEEDLGVETISNAWKSAIDRMVKNEFAVRGVFKEMRSKDIAINISSFSDYLADNYYSWKDVEDLTEELNARMRIKDKIGEVFGPPGITYQRQVREENIGDEGFLDLMLDEMVGFITEVYDTESGLVYDTPGAPDSSVAITGLGLAAIAALYQEDKISEIDAVNMISKSVNTLLNIQASQPNEKFEYIKPLFDKYPLLLIEEVVGKSRDGLENYTLADLEDFINEVKLLDEGYRDKIENQLKKRIFKNWRNSAERTQELLELLDLEELPSDNKGLEEALKAITNNQISVFTENDIKNLVELNREDIKSIRKYGWGGWLYHFVNPVEDGVPVRSDNDVELSPIDTALCVIGAKYASEVFPDVKVVNSEGEEITMKMLVDKFLTNIKMDDDLLWHEATQDEEVENYLLGWYTDFPPTTNGDLDYKGFTPLDWQYKGDERIILDMARIMWLLKKKGEGNYSEEFYPKQLREDGIVEGSGMDFIANYQNASWTFEYAHNLFDFRNTVDKNGKKWFLNTIKGLYNNRLAALQQGDYGPYSAVVGSQEIEGKGYVMSQGIDITIDNNERIFKDDPPDGTFSPYAVGLSYLPFESMASLWHQYITNPMLWEGEFGFRGSYNKKENFYSPTVYTLDMVHFLFKLVNAKSGTIWDTTSQEGSDFQKAMEAAGIERIEESELSDSDIEMNIINRVEEKLGLDKDIEDIKDYISNIDEGDLNETDYKRAEARVAQVIAMVEEIVNNRNETGLKIFRDYYLGNNDMYYDEALEYLGGINVVSNNELAVKAKALEFVINKNQHYYIEQKTSFNELVKLIDGQDSLIQIAKDIISKYDYEATVMWKDVRDGEEIPVLSSEQIKSDLKNPGEMPRTAYYPELEEYANSPFEFYPLFSEHSGLISPYIEGMDYPGGRLPGLLELADRKGWNEAVELYLEEFDIQAELKPYVEELLGRKLDIMNPDGKDAGFLAGVASEVKGGFTQGKNNRTLDEVIEKLKLEKEFLPFVKPLFGYVPDAHPEHVFDLTNKDLEQMAYLSGWADEVLKKGKSVEEIKKRLLRINMVWPYAHWKSHKGQYILSSSWYIPVIKKYRAKNAAWMETLYKGRGVINSIAHNVGQWIKQTHEAGYSYDVILKVFEAVKKYYGMGPDLNRDDLRDEHQKIMTNLLGMFEREGLLDQDLTTEDIWKAGDINNWMKYSQTLMMDDAEERFSNFWDNKLRILVENYGYGLDIFNYSAVESLYDMLMHPEVEDELGVEVNTNRWEVEEMLVDELLKISKGNRPETDEDKIENVFKAMGNIVKSFGIDEVELEQNISESEYSGGSLMNFVITPVDMLHIARHGNVYLSGLIDPFTGNKIDKKLAYYLYGGPFYDDTALLLIRGTRNK